ncbi:isocitrate lyase/PEP mutase family protein [Amycolatopsis sp. H20-H5]|uniref:isocitrate lyase/PEP mutase family protein n=1 Tax=Amycolatopsis sp. H20-H5 TaxID=3046309 RepID=UPI002DB75782|nr:isocitrate lyase/phosphoenolpyruvate mutase family protein [Amycolatopsis sp. H20-H5]MEC3980327.1 isocitrate lyase/phosphoenolpyruvate mutase family protein [Amycolatopsis sp. H20-H5]
MTADRLRALHVPGTPILLPNAWDADTAMLVEAAGFPVVATSSGAMAASLGYADGDSTPAREVFAATARIVRAVSVPVTVDAEGGYGLSSVDLAHGLLEAGAVGCNLEDTDHVRGGLRGVEAQAERIAALRAAAGDALVLNARIDVFLGARDQAAVLDEAVTRARAYLAAGADCVYPILLRSAEVLAAFTDAVRPAAVNAAYLPDGPDFTALATLGVARISLGVGLWRRSRSVIEEMLAELAAGKRPY